MADPVEFRPEITLSKDEVLDLVATCDDVVSSAEEAGAVEMAFSVEGMRQLLGRLLCGLPGQLRPGPTRRRPACRRRPRPTPRHRRAPRSHQRRCALG